MKIDTLSGIKIGDKMLRRKTGDPDTWVEFIVNWTYWDLMIEFPEDYRHLDGSEIIVLPVI